MFRWAVFGFLALLISAPAWGQGMACYPRADIKQVLSEKYGEVVVARAYTSKDWLMEIWASKGGNTWSMTASPNAERTCLLGSGTGWTAIDPVYKPLEEGL